MLTLVTSPFVAQIEKDDASLSTSLVKRHAAKDEMIRTMFASFQKELSAIHHW
jgi:hypothetical protein